MAASNSTAAMITTTYEQDVTNVMKLQATYIALIKQVA